MEVGGEIFKTMESGPSKYGIRALKLFGVNEYPD